MTNEEAILALRQLRRVAEVPHAYAAHEHLNLVEHLISERDAALKEAERLREELRGLVVERDALKLDSFMTRKEIAALRQQVKTLTEELRLATDLT